MRFLLALLAVAGCTDDSFLVVTVDARAGVHDTNTLNVTLSNGSASRSQMLPMASHAFPVTFSVDAPGRSGQIGIEVDALDTTGVTVGSGTTMANIGDKTASVMLDTTDFVVNSEVAMDQFLADGDYEAAGFQVAGGADGSFTIGFRDNCMMNDSCNMYGRRFDRTGAPVSTILAASDQQFVLSTTLTHGTAYPAVAANGMTTVAMWDFADTVGAGTGVACRYMDAMGAASSGQLSIATDAADVVSVTPLSNGNFAAVWQIYSPTVNIRTIIARPDCTTITTNPLTVSTTASSTGDGPHHAQVAANGVSLMYTWITDGDVYIRTGTNSGPAGTTDTKLLAKTTQFEARIVRIAPLGTGFAVVVRWANPSFSGPGKIELFQVSPTGAVQSASTLITDQSLSDFASGSQSFGLSTRGDGALLIAWHVCDANGTAGSCDVFGRMVRPNGTTSGDVFTIPTTTVGDQTGPSVAALQTPSNDAFVVSWTDSSHAAPDTQGKAVRARVVYPIYNPNGSM